MSLPGTVHETDVVEPPVQLRRPAAGLPVLCSDIPVLREIADGFAKFAAPDEDAFAEALLAFPRSRNERKSAAHFSWDACARETMRIYQTVLEKAGK